MINKTITITVLLLFGTLGAFYFYINNHDQVKEISSKLFSYILESKATDTLQENVSIKLKWIHQSQFAGIYVADKMGYYRENGINISVEAFDFSHTAIESVVEGHSQFGIAEADELLMAYSNGDKIVAIAVIYQENPYVAYSLKSSNILSPIDTIGKKVGIQKDTKGDSIFKAMLSAYNIDLDKDLIPTPIDFGIDELINGKVDLALGYLINEPIQAEEAGYQVNIMYPSNYDVHIYSDVLFSTEELIEKRPDLVKSFVEATLKGWRYALKNPDEAVEFTLLYEDPNNDALNFPHQKKLLNKSIPLIKPSKYTSIGEMHYLKWRKSYELLKKYELLTEEFNVTEAYSTEFLR